MLPTLDTTPLIETTDYLKSFVDWTRYFKLVSVIGDSLNSNKNRFDKSDLLEYSIEIFSGGVVKWVDENGSDLVLPNGTKLEMKYVKGCLQSSNRRTKNKIGSIKLLNSLGTCCHKTIPSDYAEYLLVCDSYMVCLIDTKTLSRYTINRGDGLYAEKIPSSLFCIVAKCGTSEIKQKMQFDYAEEKRKMQKRFIEQVV